MLYSACLLPAGHLGLHVVAAAHFACVLASEPGQLLALEQLTVPAKHTDPRRSLNNQVELLNVNYGQLRYAEAM